jgi:hypothetical protein
MRPSKEQNDFAIRASVVTGLVLIALGFTLLGFAMLTGMSMHDGGPILYLLWGFVLSVSIGLVFCLCGLVLKLTSTWTTR